MLELGKLTIHLWVRGFARERKVLLLSVSECTQQAAKGWTLDFLGMNPALRQNVDVVCVWQANPHGIDKGTGK